jgi:hypothetical protein
MSKENITINSSDSSQELLNGRATLSKAALSMIAVLLVAVALGSGYVGVKLWVRYQLNAECCQIPLSRRLVVSAKEKVGLATFYSQMGQDKWVSEAVFPSVKNGFFLDVGSGDGTLISNTKALEQKGWYLQANHKFSMAVIPWPLARKI